MVNRAAVLALWAAVVAEVLRFDQSRRMRGCSHQFGLALIRVGLEVKHRFLRCGGGSKEHREPIAMR
jgi:hypothetical protein